MNTMISQVLLGSARLRPNGAHGVSQNWEGALFCILVSLKNHPEEAYPNQDPHMLRTVQVVSDAEDWTRADLLGDFCPCYGELTWG